VRGEPDVFPRRPRSARKDVAERPLIAEAAPVASHSHGHSLQPSPPAPQLTTARLARRAPACLASSARGVSRGRSEQKPRRGCRPGRRRARDRGGLMSRGSMPSECLPLSPGATFCEQTPNAVAPRLEGVLLAARVAGAREVPMEALSIKGSCAQFVARGIQHDGGARNGRKFELGEFAGKSSEGWTLSFGGAPDFKVDLLTQFLARQVIRVWARLLDHRGAH